MAIILTKKSDTASSVPLVADLTNAAGGAELAVNTADKRLFTKTSGGSVVELGTNPSSMTLPNGTANGIPYLNASKVLTSGSALTFDGNNLAVPSGVLTVGSSTTGKYLDVLSGTADAQRVRISVSGTDGVINVTRSAGTVPNLIFQQDSSELMRLTSTGLGIGTSSITAIYGGKTVQLQSASGATSYITTGTYNAFMAATTDGKAHFGTSTGSTSVVFETANGTALTIDPSNNLGLGVTPSASTLPTIQSSYGILSGNNQTNIAANAYYNSQWNYTSTAVASLYTQTAGQHRWYTAPSGTTGNAISFTQALTLTASGELLINRTSASGLGKLNVEGGADFTNGDVYMCRDSGNLLVGATAVASSAKVLISASANTYNNLVIQDTGTTGGSYVVFTNSTAGIAGSISHSGTTTVAYNTSSDYRLKNITGPITNSGAYIDSLNPVEGTWKVDGSTFVGLIAHEAQGASRTPVATGEKDGEQMQAMDYSSPEIIANMIAELKSLRARVAQLESK